MIPLPRKGNRLTFEIALVLGILVAAVVLFVTEKLRVDLVALMVLVTLAVSGLVSPRDALSGFSNPAVVTVWAMFILSGGLQQSGVAGMVGRQVLRVAGKGEVRLVIAIMLSAGFLSAFMNNVGVAALLLPVVMDIARRTAIAPSKLLMPLSFSCLMGGLTTMIGTPPNILISGILQDSELGRFELFDFTPVGSAVLVAGVLFMVLVGRRLLPARDLVRDSSRPAGEDLGSLYNLSEQFFVVHVPEGSALAGRTLAQSRLGAVLGLNVIGILRGKKTRLAPEPTTVLEPDDRLLVEGDKERLAEFHADGYLSEQDGQLAIEELASAEIEVAELRLPPTFTGQTLRQIDFRRRFGLIVLAIQRGEDTVRTRLESLVLQRADRLLVQGPRERLDELRKEPDTEVRSSGLTEIYELEDLLMAVKVPPTSSLVGKTLTESRLGDAFGLGVLGIVRESGTRLVPEPGQRLEAGDTLFVKGKRENLSAVEGLRTLQLEAQPLDLSEIESDEVGLAEVVLSPRSSLAGMTLKELHFREKFGLNVIAISRGGETFRANVRDIPLRFGDALLLYGARTKLKVLGSEPDFIVLTQEAQEPVRLEKAPLAFLIMAAVLLPVLLGWLPIYVAAVGGAALMVLTRALSMDEAYSFIEWRAVFLIAGMLPLGLALEQSGAAQFLTQQVVGMVGEMGPRAIVATFYLVTAAAAQVMPTSAVAILMAPIALNAAGDLGLSPLALLMTVALSASASFLSPVAHPANLLIMGPGGYRFSDYWKVGLPMTLVLLVVVVLVLPLFWPLTP